MLNKKSCVWLHLEKRSLYFKSCVSYNRMYKYNSEVVYEKGKTARLKSYNYTWEKKAEFYQEIYKRIVFK